MSKSMSTSGIAREIKRTTARLTTLSLTLIAAVALTGCIPTHEHPLSEPGASVDPGLLGAWSWQEREGPCYAHIGVDGETVRIVTVKLDKRGRQEVTVVEGHPTEVAGTTYLNLRMTYQSKVDADGPPVSSWLIVRVRLDGDALSLDFLKDKLVTAAIERGELESELQPSGKLGVGTHVTASPEAMRAFLAEHGDELFYMRPDPLRRLPAP